MIKQYFRNFPMTIIKSYVLGMAWKETSVFVSVKVNKLKF